MIETRAVGMTAFPDYPGYVAIAGNKSDVYIVNVFTMEVENHLGLTSEGFHSINSEGPSLTIIDSLGATVELLDFNHG